MSVELVFASLLAAALAQQALTPYCPDRAAPREVDSPCTDGCRFLCGQTLCQITRTATGTSVNCGGDAFRPFCGGDTPNPSTDLFCTSGCTYFCSGGSQNSRCTMTLDRSANRWSLSCQPLPTKTETATDCSTSSTCSTQVGQCTQFARRCTCFSDGSIKEAGCFRVPGQSNPPTPGAPFPTPPPTPTGGGSQTRPCPSDPTCISFWPNCSQRDCVCSVSSGQLITSNCNDPPTPAPPTPFNQQFPTPFPTPFNNNFPTPFPTPYPFNNGGSPTPAPTPYAGPVQACLAQVCDQHMQSVYPCTTASGASCTCDSANNVVTKTCPMIQLTPCVLSLPGVKTQCDAFRAQTGTCTTSTGAVCLCNSQNTVASKSCSNPMSSLPLVPGGMVSSESACTPDLQKQCEDFLMHCTRSKICLCSQTAVVDARCSAAQMASMLLAGLFALLIVLV